MSDRVFSAKDIKVTTMSMSIYSLIGMLKKDEIELYPSFRKERERWTERQMSQFIESILLRLPLQIFYFDVANPEKWLVVDGLRRLYALQEFIVKESFVLEGLELLTYLNGKRYLDLEKPLKRIIDTKEIGVSLIEAQTPKEVRYSIYKRINKEVIK